MQPAQNEQSDKDIESLDIDFTIYSILLIDKALTFGGYKSLHTALGYRLNQGASTQKCIENQNALPIA